MNKKYTQEEVRNIFVENGCVMLEEYKNSEIPIKFKCNCGGLGKVLIRNFKKGVRCKKCSTAKMVETQKEKYQYAKKYEELFEKEGFKLITPYVRRSDKVKLQCEKNHIIELTPERFKAGTRCKECRKLKLSEERRKKEELKGKKMCEICKVNERRDGGKGNSKFCLDCSKQRRKEKFKEYNEKRDEEDVKKYKVKINKNRKEKRKKLKEQGLCTECGNKAMKGLTKCEPCQSYNLKKCEKYNRLKGIEEAGGSKHETLTSKILRELVNEEIKERIWGIVRNPITNYSLQLDFYIPNLKLAIEVDGPMHRKPIYGIERFRKQVFNDCGNNQDCLNKQISLLRINTDEIDEKGEEWLKEVISEFLMKNNIYRQKHSSHTNSLLGF